jgi:hypothetical protein
MRMKKRSPSTACILIRSIAQCGMKAAWHTGRGEIDPGAVSHPRIADFL